MPLFGKKKETKTDINSILDFSNDTWSYKGEAPEYQIQSDGFSYDITDADGNDKNAISLGLAGMLVIVLNAKSPKIKENEILPHLGTVIKTKNWHSMTVKEANFLVQTAIKKLTSSAMSGDVFDLASYAPLEVKRVLLKTMFTISRLQTKPEFREEAEHRIIDDIVPEIFANPEYELALLTGLIIKPDTKEKTAVSVSNESHEDHFIESSSFESVQDVISKPIEQKEEPDSAFAELQKIYGRKNESEPVQNNNPVQYSGNDSQLNSAMEEPKEDRTDEKSEQNEIISDSVQKNASPQQQNPFGQAEPKNIPQPMAPNFSPMQQQNNPFNRGTVPQPMSPNFSVPQPGNPFMPSEGAFYPQNVGIPQPPAPNWNNMQANNPYNMNMQGNGNMPIPPNNGMYQGNPYGNYPQQYNWQQQNPSRLPNVPQAPFPGQMTQNPYTQESNQNFRNGQNNPNYPGRNDMGPNGSQFPPQNNPNNN